MFGALQAVMVTAISSRRRPSRRRIVELLWRQVLASVGLATVPTSVEVP